MNRLKKLLFAPMTGIKLPILCQFLVVKANFHFPLFFGGLYKNSSQSFLSPLVTSGGILSFYYRICSVVPSFDERKGSTIAQ